MYATIIRCDLRALASTAERGRTGRSLAAALGVLRGFVALVALDADAEAAGIVVALCIVEDRASLAAAQRRTAE